MTSQVDGSQPERKSWIANTVSHEAIYRKYIYDIWTATWLSHGDRNDEQQLGRARLLETGLGRRGRPVFGVWLGASRYRWSMEPRDRQPQGAAVL